ncbi:RNA polymerase 2 mediator complex component [Niveomyces insectorum RCEF 264]|uniref:RNA polymerase 2 mediator complex component n=1 Tax=Niveomyces insectorum RCEF 264 TaxID=1081102 RepID=A0A167T751_9HYPO|nr:RNA polymerase 2 mediator complex component [Niveomyces insectorum RCEF 264]
MAALFETKACVSCAKAKRKCGKERPACRRCQDRCFGCEYPPTKPSSFVVLDTIESFATPSPGGERDLDIANVPQPHYGLAFPCTSHPSHVTTPDPSESAPSTSRESLPWFLGPDTWKIEHQNTNVAANAIVCSSFLHSFVHKVQEWLRYWAKTGSNPFIHSHLYAACIPDCVQIAYTTLTSYIHRTDKNAEIVLCIVEEQASKLLANNGVALDNRGSSSATNDASATSFNDESQPKDGYGLLDQLARTHALLVYQMISLFDGNIRARHLAEKRLGLLSIWASQLMNSARQKFALPSTALDMALSLPAGSTAPAEQMWYLWVLTESIRRTWSVATGLETTYFMLQRGYHDCPGGVMHTNRQGVWNAETALAWTSLCEQTDVQFLQRVDTETLFTKASPADVDDFGLMMLEISFGIERIEKWRRDKGEIST